MPISLHIVVDSRKDSAIIPDIKLIWIFFFLFVLQGEDKDTHFSMGLVLTIFYYKIFHSIGIHQESMLTKKFYSLQYVLAGGESLAISLQVPQFAFQNYFQD